MKKLFVRTFIDLGLVVGQEKDVSLFLDRTGEPATQQQVSSRLKNKDTFFCNQQLTPYHKIVIEIVQKLLKLSVLDTI